MDILLTWFGGKLLDVLPNWLLRRLVKLTQVAQQVKLDLRGPSPVSLSLSSAVPIINVWFEVQNHSVLDLTLDRIVVDISVGQQIAYGVMAHRYPVAHHTTESGIYFVATLTPGAVELIKQQASTPGTRFVRVGARAYFETKLGWFAVEGVNLIRDLPAF
jgi:hypothetical protein